MSSITISEERTAAGFWRFPGATCELRIAANQSFRNSDGELVPRGLVSKPNTCLLVTTCTVNDDLSVSIPAITELCTTDDSIDLPTATFTAALFPRRSSQRQMWPDEVVASGFAIYTSQAPACTWTQIVLRNLGASLIDPPDTWWNSDEIIRYVRTVQNPKATTVISGTARLDVPAVDSSDPEVVGSNSPLVRNNARVFNVQNPAYAGGARGNGTADDTAAILATITAAEANGGGKLYFPHPTNSYLISGSGAQILLTTKPLIIEGEDENTIIKIKSTVASGVYAFRYKPTTSADSEGFQMRNLWILPQSGTPGAGICLDSTNAPIANFNISNVIVSQLGGKALTLTNPTHRTDGIFLGTTEKSQFAGDVLYDYVGDSVRTINNDFNGAGTVDVTLIGGAGTPDFSENNITCDGGVIFRSGKNIRFHHNQIELQVVSNTGSGGAMVQFLGDIGAIQDASIKHNLMQGGGAAPSLNAFRFDNQQGSSLGDNTYTLPTGKAMLDVGLLSSFFFLNEPNHARGASTTEVSNGMLYFYLPAVTVGAAAAESGGAVWITNVKGTHLVSTTDSSLANISTGNQITSTLPAGTPPFVIASDDKVVNLNADKLDGTDWRAPGAIGGTTPASGAFTTLSATGQVTSTLATGTAPLAITSTTPVANLTATPLTYRPDGTQITNAHIVSGTVVLDGAGTATVTLVGGAVYASATAFQCVAGYNNSGGAPQIVKNSGTSITFNGTAAFTIWFICISY